MAKFTYTAIDKTGKQKSGRIEANDERDAQSKLTAMGLVPTAVQADKGGSQQGPASKVAGPADVSKAKRARISSTERATFTRQLATLLEAGLPLVRALNVLQRQQTVNRNFGHAIASISEGVQTGNSLSDGMAQFPALFDFLYLNMIRAGEASGQLAVVLSRLASFMEKSERVQKKVKSAMVYPAVVLSVAAIIVALLMIKVVPKFQDMFKTMLKGKQLPAPTEILIWFSDFCKEYWYVGIIFVAALIIGFNAFRKSKAGVEIIDRFLLKLPKLDTLIVKIAVSRFTRTFGTLISSGVPMLEALNISRDVAGNSVFSRALQVVHDRVRDGENLATPLSQAKIFPDIVSSMVEVGEETGELPQMLNRVADNYDEDVDNAVTGMTSIIEPLLIVMLAVIVGFIVLALFLPMFELIGNTGGR